MAKPKRWGKSLFLNEPWSVDSGALVGSTSYEKRKEYNDMISASLLIWDCDRKVALDFDVSAVNEEKASARRKKIRKLRKFINEFADNYEAMLDKLEAENKKKPAKT